MKFSLKTLAAAVVMAVSASGASAAIDAGATGNGELFFNIWDANGSYTLDLNISISSFESQVAAGGFLNLAFAADPLLNSFFAGTSAAGERTGAFKFNVTANDNEGAGANSRRSFQTFTEPKPATTLSSTVARNVNGATLNFATQVNNVIGANDSVAVDKNSPAYAGKAAFADKAGNFLNFSNAGGIANDSYASGLSFMVIGANSIGSTASTYTQLFDFNGGLTGQEIHVWLGADKTLHIQAVPEPETYAMLLAGLGMLGFMARRRLNNRV